MLTSSPTVRIFIYTIVWLLRYGVLLLGVHWLNGQRGAGISLTGIVDLCKGLSLWALVMSGGDIWHHQLSLAERTNSRFLMLVGVVNRGVVWVSGALAILVFCKVFAFKTDMFNFEKLTAPSLGFWVESFLKGGFVYCTMIPIFAYAILNSILAFYPLPKSGVATEVISDFEYGRRKSLLLLVYSNLTVVIPLIFVIAAVNMSSIDGISMITKDVFLSGAMAVIIMASAISAKAVELYNS
ncbi:hypothetical protein [Antarctobacter heliothermus]|uniref:Uncharacterized protein n=1 Tax=Antarctobacter heliothermus TaxID=74033 RepID=A0A239CTE2_9RHOB|nr:hypothetical protein [Antarctobacter heliothermus]SNS23516.1 hypothetical protein SAMN04488078_100833 [Antarctobacter heliothermus]